VSKGFTHKSIASDFSGFEPVAHPPDWRRNGGEMEYFYYGLKKIERLEACETKW
jgi:hypothetical protein